MDAIPAPVQLLCRQCSAPLPIETGMTLVECEYCGTSNYVERGRTVFHFVLRTTVREDAAHAALRRWMGGNKTVKRLDTKARIEKASYQLVPMWFVRVTKDGAEKVLLEPAAALAISELKHVNIPAADLEPYDQVYDDSALKATVPYNALLRWLEDDHKLKAADIREVSLVHMPIYHFKYSYDGRSYTAVVDAATSEVFANIYPSKWEVPYLGVGAAAFASFFCASLAPAIGFLTGGTSGLGTGMAIYAVAVVILAVAFFAAAAVVSSRV